MTAPDPLARAVTCRLRAAGCVAADEEAGELLASAPDESTLEAWIERREAGEPLAWITGSVEFCGNRIHVDSGVYVPRLQSEELARRAAALLAGGAGTEPRRAVDLGSGAGAIAIHLMAAVPSATVIGVDIDMRAVACSRRNGVRALLADLDPPLASSGFDVVTAVAPYVPTRELRFLPADVQRYEPRRALDGGEDGLELVRRCVVAAARLLRPGGWLLLELGADQDQVLGPNLEAAGLEVGEVWADEDGDLRGLAARQL